MKIVLNSLCLSEVFTALLHTGEAIVTAVSVFGHTANHMDRSSDDSRCCRYQLRIEIDKELNNVPICVVLNHMQSWKYSLCFAVHVVLCQHPVIISTVKITFNLIIHLCVVGCSFFIEPVTHILLRSCTAQKNTGIMLI